ncbi:sulfurtransferase [Parvibium lacunae]|uniref:Sulfurtransferase n=1 Tax=Parvibium lacunae TaxID=1888893 RepID=A0A368L6F7_9BURK|nr:sulfurtransferase [Parvibium lacunae]RCS59245.1 sulfurtransferase [Parvibium lacunae]
MYSTLIQASTLQNLLADSTQHVILVDCRHDLANPSAGQAAYAEAHLPGARFAHLDTDLSAAKNGKNGRHPLPTRAVFAETLGRWGIDNDTQVIAYDAQGGMFAARLWWMLRWCGHRAVAVLDGGLPAWQAINGVLTSELSSITATTFMLQPELVELVVVEQVEANLTAPQPRLIVDARSPDRFRGENETLDPVGGHIPGAANRFFKDNLQTDGTFKPAEVLRTEWQAVLESRAPAQTIMQCGSGATACHNYLAMEVAGLGGAGLYAGSWSEWCSDASRPISRD